jgi:hypothetical protein
VHGLRAVVHHAPLAVVEWALRAFCSGEEHWPHGACPFAVNLSPLSIVTILPMGLRWPIFRLLFYIEIRLAMLG